MRIPKTWPAIPGIVLASLAILAFSSFVFLIIKLVPTELGIDWRLTYRPAALALLHGENPYAVEVAPGAPFFAAPWGLLPLIPIALLPVSIGRALIMLGGLIAFGYAAYRLGARPFLMGLFLLSPPVMHNILNANIEWIPVLGFVLPPTLGLFFVSVKPQTGFAVAIFWFYDAWHRGGWREVLRTFAPVTLALLISFIIYGVWPLGMSGVLEYGDSFNTSLWPYSIPVGIALLAISLIKKDIKFAMPASPCLSPYVLFHAWSSATIFLVTSPFLMTILIIGLWVMVALRAFSF